tara:strand:+ start:110 stop:514 length:405 start_codon:yes stop_codon:yes gene_type:complete
MKLTEAKLKQMILNEMNSSPIDPMAEKLAQKFLEVGDSGPHVRQIYELAVTLGYVPEEGYLESLEEYPEGTGRAIEFVASPAFAQAMERVMSGNETLDIYPIEERTINVMGKMVPIRKAAELPGTYIVSYIARP